MPKIVDKVELTKDEIRAWELSTEPHNLSIKQIAQRMRKSVTSVNRYLHGYRTKVKPDTTSELLQREKEIEQKCWDTIIEALEATKLFGKDAIIHPDYNVRASTAFKYLESKGIIKIKDGKSGDINITNVVQIEQTREKKLNQGLNRFGYEIKTSDN